MFSRIFVRGLPPKFTDTDFKSHFEKFSPITDAKYIPNRRIGYVGYKTTDEAERAIKYFNNTYIRMSKICVEYAKPFGDESLPRAWSAHTPGSSAHKRKMEQQSPKLKECEGSSTKKQKTILEQNVLETPNLKELLEVSKPSSKSKIWSDAGVLRTDEVPMTLIEDGESDDEYDELPKVKGQKSEEKLPEIWEGGTSVYPQTLAPETNSTMEKEEVEQPALSDADWLRAKMSRTLDLTDDVDARLSLLEGASLAAPAMVAPKEAEPEMAEDEDLQELDNVQEVVNCHADPNAENDATAEEIMKSSRLFIRNLPYTTTEDDLREAFSSFGELIEVHLSVDDKKNSSKGFAFVLFTKPEDAVEAYQSMDKKIFQGRLIHVLPAQPKREYKLDEYQISQLPLKKQLEIKRKQTAAKGFNWNSMYMNVDAVMSSIADRLGVSKAELLDPTSADAAIKQAHAETHVIQETKQYLQENGCDLSAFGKKVKDDRIILVKNFPFGTTVDELRAMFSEFGQLNRFLMSPAGTMAIVEFQNSPAARSAYTNLAYRRLKSSILMLEKGPKDLFIPGFVPNQTVPAPNVKYATIKAPKVSGADLLEPESVAEPEDADTSTLFVRNLNFSTTTEILTRVFKPITGFVKATVKTKSDPKNPGKTLSMGFGFVEFRTKGAAQTAMKAMQGYTLEGHQLLIKTSHKGLDAAAERRREDLLKKLSAAKTKIVIKNLPFEASKQDIYRLLSPYGTLKSVRLPKKFGGPSRGFAFAEFTTAKDAAAAMSSLIDTHLLGRKLVLEFAAQDAVTAEEEIDRMEKKASKQADMMSMAQVRDMNKRKRFQLNDAEGDE